MKAFKNLRWLLLPLTLVGAACSSILGIEDIHRDPKAGTGEGGDGNGGTGGGKGGKGGTSGVSGSVGNGGTSGASGGTGTGGTGDAGGGAGDDTGGTSGAGGAPDGTVRGRVVTTWLQPIPNVEVMIGDAEAVTNADGEFEIPDVASEYDAKFVVTFDAFGTDRTYGWVYQGLTRRDPTLAVYDALSVRSARIVMQPSNLTGTDFSNKKLLVALGGPDGAPSFEVSLPNGTDTSGGWRGPATMNVTAHALLFEMTTEELPTVYRSFNEQPVVLSEMTPVTATFDLPDETVASGTIAGTVTGPSDDRTNYVYLRFESNAAMQLVELYGSSLDPVNFTYAVPSVPGSSIEVAALEGGWSYGPAAIAHRDRLAPGQMNVALEIPLPPEQVAPVSNTSGVDETTLFSWTSSARTFVWNADNVDPNGPFNGIFVVTTEKRVTLPSFPNGFTWVPNNLYEWRVQTHGDAASVDELAGPEGFADSYAPYAEGPETPRRGDGSYTISGGRIFTTAP